jgi:hypothetical protein
LPQASQPPLGKTKRKGQRLMKSPCGTKHAFFVFTITLLANPEFLVPQAFRTREIGIKINSLCCEKFQD